jgi:HSP20 family protein
MSNKDIDNYDLFKRFLSGFGSSSRGGGSLNNRRLGLLDTRDMFREFEDIQEEMSRMFNAFNDISSNVPKEMVREYQTSKGDKVREVGPIVYGYSMTVGPDGRPHVREFGNVKSLGGRGIRGTSSDIDATSKPTQITAEREPLVDVNSTDNEVKVVLEMPGIKKEDIKINAFDGEVEVIADNPQRKYHKNIEIPKDADIETARSTYNNGILEVTFDKKKNIKPKGKQIKIE